MNIDINEMIRVIGSLYLETHVLKQENIMLQAQIAELTKPEQAEDESAQRKTVAGLTDTINGDVPDRQGSDKK